MRILVKIIDDNNNNNNRALSKKVSCDKKQLELVRCKMILVKIIDNHDWLNVTVSSDVIFVHFSRNTFQQFRLWSKVWICQQVY